jgi:Mor family transcriptional regulator
MTDDRKMNAPEFLADLLDIVSRTAQELGQNTEWSDELADKVVDRVCEEWGGLPIYIGKGTHMRLSKRDLEVYREWEAAGNNHQELAHKHKISKAWVYAIIRRVKRQLEAERKKGQQPLL